MLLARHRSGVHGTSPHDGTLNAVSRSVGQLDREKNLSDSNVLCTDSCRAFSSYTNTKCLAHYRFKSDGKQRIKGVYHILNVNSYHSNSSYVEIRQ